MPQEQDVPVLIIGAGPSGLALAIELGSRGVRCIIVERNDRVGYAPRAKTTNVRTRTHLRRWGIADKLAQVSPFGIDYPSDVLFVTRLGGHLLARIENASNCAPARNDLYPEHGQWVPQYKLEQVLRSHVETLPGVELRFSTEIVDATQEDGGVRATLRRIGEENVAHVDAAYLVGADGARSLVRDLISVKMHGTYGLSRNRNIVFRAPGLAERHALPRGTMYWQVNAGVPSVVGPMDEDDVWFFTPTRLPDDFVIAQESASALIQEATGIEGEYEILSNDEWVASSLLADRYRDDRIFLIGDACHLHPPFGGYGMNMGVADGVDLGWKLAAVLQGWGGPCLLDSYEIERRAIHQEVIDEATANHAVLSNDLVTPALEDDGEEGAAARARIRDRILATKTREFHTLGTVLGGCYGPSPVLPDVTPPSVGSGGRPTYEPSSRPGCLAPHLWRADGRSLYDLFGQRFTLVCRDGMSMPAETDDLTVISLAPGEGEALFPAAYTLIRPDQYVAWRGDDWDASRLETASGMVTESIAGEKSA